MTHVSSVEPTGYPRIAPKSHAIAARRHPQWATCNFLVVPTSLGAAGSRYGVTGDEKVGTAAAVLVTMPDTMDTLLTSRARRVAVQRPRTHPVPRRVPQAGDPSYLGKKYDLFTRHGGW